MKNNLPIITQLFDYAFEQKEKYGHDIFIESSPHINQVSVRAMLGGWKSDKEFDFKEDAYLSSNTEGYETPLEILFKNMKDFIDEKNKSQSGLRNLISELSSALKRAEEELNKKV